MKESPSRRWLVGRDLLRDALHFPHLAEIVRREVEASELEDGSQRLLFEALARIVDGSTSLGSDDVALLLEDPEARHLAHILLAEPAGEVAPAEERVQAGLEFLRRDRVRQRLSEERSRVIQALGSEGDEGEKDRVMTDYLDRLRQEAERRRSRT